MNLWILTEERPKENVIQFIIDKFKNDKKVDISYDSLKIVPVLDKKSFDHTFTYLVKGFTSKSINQIILKIVSGDSSFVDFLVFHQEKEPIQSDIPIFAIEETKTDDSESRNTGVYQRASKFVYIDYYYPNIDKTMLYNLKITQKKDPTATSIFGSRCLRTLGVKFIGKRFDERTDEPWKNIDDLIKSKDKMKGTKNGTSIKIIKVSDKKITISGKLQKLAKKKQEDGSVKTSYNWSDPSIGTLTLIASTLRKLGWSGEIEITKHELIQKQLNTANKFTLIANKLNITLTGPTLLKQTMPPLYWHYEDKSEKLGSIFLHNTILFSRLGDAIFENHAGSEKGYFITSKNEYLSLDKKTTDKKPIAIPDLILIDPKRNEIINVEAKQYSTRRNGVEELNGYDEIENLYIKKHYPGYKVIRTVVLYGDDKEEVDDVHISFLLNKNGRLVLATNAPSLMHDAIKHLKDYWENN